MAWPVMALLHSLAFPLPLSSSTLDAKSGGTSLSVEKTEEALKSPNGVFSAGFYSLLSSRSQGNYHSGFYELFLDNDNVLRLLYNGPEISSVYWPDPWLASWEAGRNSYNNSRIAVLNSLGNFSSSLMTSSSDVSSSVLTHGRRVLSPPAREGDAGNPGGAWRRVRRRMTTRFSGQIDRWTTRPSGRCMDQEDNLEVRNLRWRMVDFLELTAARGGACDYGAVLHRRLTVDYDGNIRLYSWEEERQTWVVSWQAIQTPCNIHFACGANSLCSYAVSSGRKCSCLPGYKMKNCTDWAYGCEPEFDLSCDKNEFGFMLLSYVEFYGYDYGFHPNYTFDKCWDLCLQLCDCKAFQYSFKKDTGFSTCYLKTLLLNGYQLPSFSGDLFLKGPQNNILSYAKPIEEFNLNCSSKFADRTNVERYENGTIKFVLWFASGVAALEVICIFVVWCLLNETRKRSVLDKQGYDRAAIRFRKFTYAELKKATRNFTEEIGRGAGGIVYKGVLSENQVAAIKRLNKANQGEGEFLAEVSIIGRINHMNLIEMWGYCAEGKHRLLVYEYMEHGSLANNLSANALDWEKRFQIIVGTAKGLAYLHEDCLDWILHCDVKPQNILLDSNYQPKVADFGLSKLQNRGILKNSSFSKIRGTRGYMAPEWVFNLPITSKVDVYSYGIVMLEIVTGKGPLMSVHAIDDNGEAEHKRLVTWVREKMKKVAANTSLLEEIIDPMLEGKYDMGEMEALVQVALQCVEEDKDERPTMSQVVEMLLRQEKSHGLLNMICQVTTKFHP
ncbi:hypothetical protein RGQ29_009392 [Quercus rubra]|uniref:non-specific serine/threonine protein kinase n=1 Tax=Quercus rubra TaxID=3512 RepID=A0AAN7J5W6_QUERU|nr:hypothetical protein RGQ29_009392 [Quercus rubra]